MSDPARVPVSVLLPIKNEAANLARCLDSIKWADEIFVVDSQSTDESLAIAREYHDPNTEPEKNCDHYDLTKQENSI